MRFLSLFSGIDAASVAWVPMGWECVGFAEVEPYPCSVLRQRWPGVPNLGDVSTIGEAEIEALGQIDLVVFGFPCQDLSVAGQRAGLQGGRSGLFYEATRIVRLAERCGGCSWFLAENVPGLFSSGGGRDFSAVLGEITGLVLPVPQGGWRNSGVAAVDSGWSCAWRVLDARYFGLAQRRSRVFIVGSTRGWTRPTAVLFEPSCLSGNTPPGRKTGAEIAGTLGGGSGTRGWSDDLDRAGRIPDDGLGGVARSLTCHPARHDATVDTFIPETAFCLPAASRGTGHGQGWNSNYVAHTLRGEGFDASEDGPGRGTPLVPCPGLGGSNVDSRLGEPIPFDTTQITSAANRSQPRAGDTGLPLAAGAHPPAIAFQERGRQDGPQCESQEELAYSLNAPSGDGRRQEMNIATPAAVRRLTPEECEALQGFPRGYTLVDHNGKPGADGPRYKALGNSFPVPVIQWIGKRIQAAYDSRSSVSDNHSHN